MFTFCPSCASKNISFEKNRVFRCPDCGFVYYHNTAAATGCLICVPDAGEGEKFVFLVRNREPAKGKLDLPGGFVDPGEGVLEGLYRELREEIGWVPPVPPGENLTRVFALFASFPNVYQYKNVKYNTCDMYFTVSAPGLALQDLRIEQAEIAQVLFLGMKEIDYGEFAFESTRNAVQAYFSISHP